MIPAGSPQSGKMVPITPKATPSSKTPLRVPSHIKALLRRRSSKSSSRSSHQPSASQVPHQAVPKRLTTQIQSPPAPMTRGGLWQEHAAPVPQHFLIGEGVGRLEGRRGQRLLVASGGRRVQHVRGAGQPLTWEDRGAFQLRAGTQKTLLKSNVKQLKKSWLCGQEVLQSSIVNSRVQRSKCRADLIEVYRVEI